jgi:hypothetical protein
MIDISSLEPQSLPSVPLNKKSQLPPEPCIYFAIDSQDVIQYIGRTVNAKARWAGHHRLFDLKLIGGVRIAYLMLDQSLLNEVEKALINWFDPPLNGGDGTDWLPKRKPIPDGSVVPTVPVQLPRNTPVTTIKTSAAFRDLVKKLAHSQGVSMAVYLEKLRPHLEHLDIN